MSRAAAHRELGVRINREIWNERRVERIPNYFAPEFVADYSPYAVHRGYAGLRGMVERAHATFAGFREELRTVVADERAVVVHFTIRGRHVGAWGPVPPTGREVAFDEIVVMTIEGGRVVHQIGVVDNLRGLQQIGVLPAPRPAPDGDAGA